MNSVEEWEAHVREQVQTARAVLRDNLPNQCWLACGFAVEYALKAVIQKQERMNRWPSKEKAPELYTHDLNYLVKRAGIDLKILLRHPVGARFKVALMWQRADGYKFARRPMKTAQDMLDSVCGPEGVLRWLAERYRLDI